MDAAEERTSMERAKIAAIIDSIALSFEQLHEKLSDDRKIRMFKMKYGELKKLALEVKQVRTGMKAITLLIAAIRASEQLQDRTPKNG